MSLSGCTPAPALHQTTDVLQQALYPLEQDGKRPFALRDCRLVP